MPKFTVYVEGHFDAAHFLPRYKGKCHNLHGHRWVVRLYASASRLNPNGMVVDFGRLKEVLNPILDKLDHKCLNDVFSGTKTLGNPPNPTAERLAQYIYRQAKKQLPTYVYAVEVFESPGCCVRYGGESDA